MAGKKESILMTTFKFGFVSLQEVPRCVTRLLVMMQCIPQFEITLDHNLFCFSRQTKRIFCNEKSLLEES